ncbi:MAG: 30S ribosomal protein S9 [Lentisphaerae bacterium GWF2_52_8]|nr:MAG: 30S ribosomal protein S9 [Lentisphaerae bacterium GWF2_52_8]
MSTSTTKHEEIRATGRRKTATASVRLSPGTGKFKINGRSLEEHFKTEAVCGYVMQTLSVTGCIGRYDIFASIKGGGLVGQAGALRHAIARALVKSDESLRSPLKNSGMLTRDSREKERKKPGQPGARKRFQFSKR